MSLASVVRNATQNAMKCNIYIFAGRKLVYLKWMNHLVFIQMSWNDIKMQNSVEQSEHFSFNVVKKRQNNWLERKHGEKLANSVNGFYEALLKIC